MNDSEKRTMRELNRQYIWEIKSKLQEVNNKMNNSTGNCIENQELTPEELMFLAKCRLKFLHQWVRYKSITGMVKLVAPDYPIKVWGPSTGPGVVLDLSPSYVPWSGWSTKPRVIQYWANTNPENEIVVLPEDEQVMCALSCLG